MKKPFYRGDGRTESPETAQELPNSQRERRQRPGDYLADEGLVDAVNVALLLAQPLLLTGEPGTGKTQLAASLAWELGYDEPLKFETKSTSTAQDLFYSYDALGRFHAAQTKVGSGDPREYLTYNALGLAILLANDEDAVRDVVPPGFEHGGRRRNVVLIDEIDKAPRDFPNDLLSELEGMYFRIPELGNRSVAADLALQPVVVITSNSEKDLPDAFLRRCIYYDVPFPPRERLEKIVNNRLGTYAGGSSQFLSDTLDIFELIRQPASGLHKPPATAELLDWLLVTRQTAPEDEENPIATSPEGVLRGLSALAKTANDLRRAREIAKSWLQGQGYLAEQESGGRLK